MLVNVWSATWEIDRCQPEAIVGKVWKVPALFTSRTGPWFDVDASTDEIDQHKLIGVTELYGVTQVELLSEEIAVAESGGARFRIPAAELREHLIGRLFVDAHTDFEDSESIRIPELSGIVEQVQLVPIEYVRKHDRYFEPKRQLEPIPVHSSLERDRFSSPLEDKRETSIEYELLVTLLVPAGKLLDAPND